MAYLPKNKYKILYTKGDTYKLKTSGKPYTGEYLSLTDGRLFAGNNPNELKGRLVPILTLQNNNVITKTVNNRVYQALQRKRSLKQDKYIPIPSSIPTPTPVDYGNNFFNRYISVRLNTKEYQEISEDTYINFGKRKYNQSLNKTFFIKWSLTEDNELENTLFLRNLEETLPGIFDFFVNKGKYGVRNGTIRITSSNRIYLDGKFIDKSLPAAYQLGNKNPNSIDNLNVPKNQHCGNCIFNQKGNCTRWEANIKHEFWCRAFKGKYNIPDKFADPSSAPSNAIQYETEDSTLSLITNEILPSSFTDSTDGTTSSPSYGGDDPNIVKIGTTPIKGPSTPSKSKGY